MRYFLLATAIAAISLGAPAEARTQLEQSVSRELRERGFGDVDVTKLTVSQLAAIHHTTTRSGREGQRRGEIRAILNQPISLRGLFRR
jgi:hypothetical protein